MPKITVDHRCSLNADEAFVKIKSFFEGDADIRRLDPKLQCTFDPKSMTGKATGSQFKADISVKAENNGAFVQVIVDLPLLLTPIKGKVQETIQRKLAKHLG
jgi:hypothetical protein